MDLDYLRSRTLADASQTATNLIIRYGEDQAAEMVAAIVDGWVRALGHMVGPQEARHRLEEFIGSLPVAHNSGGIRLVVNNG